MCEFAAEVSLEEALADSLGREPKECQPFDTLASKSWQYRGNHSGIRRNTAAATNNAAKINIAPTKKEAPGKAMNAWSEVK